MTDEIRDERVADVVAAKASIEAGLLGMPGVIAVDVGFKSYDGRPSDVPVIRVFADGGELGSGQALERSGVPIEIINVPPDGVVAMDDRGVAGTRTTAADLGFNKASSLPYDHFGLETGTPLHETGGTFEFLLSYNLDLYAIKKSGTASGSTEVHVLSAASNYQEFSLHTGTALEETDDRWSFGLFGQGHVVGIKKSGTASGMTELHFLDAGTRYQTFSRHVVTALHQTDGTYRMLMQTLGDLYVIKKAGTGSGKTEVHALTLGSGYQQFRVHTPTVLPPTDGSIDFQIQPRSPDPDLYVVSKRTGTGKTRIHVLTASSNYTDYRLRVDTAVEETDDRFHFLLAPQYNNPSFYAIKKHHTGTNSTEVHVLPG